MPETPDVDFLDKYREADNEQQEHKRRNTESAETNDEDDMQGYSVQDYFEDEQDDEGRFFGGGLTDEQSRLLDLVDEYDVEEASTRQQECTICPYNATYTWKSYVA